MKKEYIYLNINPDNEKVVKVGKTTKKPILRAREMDRKSHNVNNWIVEKYWEVFDCSIAEKIAHYSLQEYSYSPEKRELFEIDKEKAIEIIDKNLTVFSCSMNKENIENTYFENKKYVATLEAKIQDLEGALKVISVLVEDTKDNTETTTENYETELRTITRLLEKKPNNEFLLRQKDIYLAIEGLIILTEFSDKTELLAIHKEIIELGRKIKPNKIKMFERLVAEKQDILDLLDIVSGNNKLELENELKYIQIRLNVLLDNIKIPQKLKKTKNLNEYKSIIKGNIQRKIKVFSILLCGEDIAQEEVDNLKDKLEALEILLEDFK